MKTGVLIAVIVIIIVLCLVAIKMNQDKVEKFNQGKAQYDAFLLSNLTNYQRPQSTDCSGYNNLEACWKAHDVTFFDLGEWMNKIFLGI